MVMPGFGSFRYPSKLLTFMAVGLAVLAGLGWDCVTEGGVDRDLAASLFIPPACSQPNRGWSRPW